MARWSRGQRRPPRARHASACPSRAAAAKALRGPAAVREATLSLFPRSHGLLAVREWYAATRTVTAETQRRRTGHGRARRGVLRRAAGLAEGPRGGVEPAPRGPAPPDSGRGGARAPASARAAARGGARRGAQAGRGERPEAARSQQVQRPRQAGRAAAPAERAGAGGAAAGAAEGAPGASSPRGASAGRAFPQACAVSAHLAPRLIRQPC
mmetsp:Transcript_10065/g.31635  ORF Transcript_10065/g.31635 Transcript_10065/m.31635 type:complete len:211 (+) Transcript_10065:711-1343(+)